MADQIVPEELKSPATMAGNLQCKSSGMFKSFKVKWYELHGTALYYFPEANGKPKGRIALSGATLHTEGKTKIGITSPINNRSYELIADSDDVGSRWISCLQRAIEQAMMSPTAKAAKKTPDQTGLLDKLMNLKLFESNDARPKVGLQDYDVLALLGKGSYGKVIKVKAKSDGKFYAMKIMRKEAITKPKEVMSERSVLQCIDHPYVVRLENAFQTPSKLFIILNYLPNGTLKMQLRAEKIFSEDKSRHYAAQLLLAVEYLHGHSIIYRDMKPDNVVLDEMGNAVITDMGLARDLTEDASAFTFCGTPLYVAPEVLANKGYGMGVDWWSYGIIVYEMLVGVTPFAAKTAQAVFQLIMTKQVRMPENLSPAAQDFLARILIKDPAQRLTDPTIMKRHPFFQGVDWDGLMHMRIPVPGGFTRIPSTEEPLTPEQVQELVKDSAAKGENFMGFTFDAKQMK
jgi:hypothetical protein